MPPLGAIFVAFFAVAVPAILLMAVWAGVTAFRILFPDEPLPLDPVARRRRLAARGESVPVRLRDIMEDERARQATSAAERVVPRGTPPSPRTHPLFDDLWLRRN
ncbi:hypothetical protein [Rubrivirga sp.]|uniref:hypothetical protein n=1 Tax=Rubrivirga sp. TaxID=1885344 RepID=UPI003B520200